MLGVKKNFLWIIIYKDKLKNSNYLKIKFVEVFMVVYINDKIGMYLNI